MADASTGMEKLKQGYWRFRTGKFERERWLYEKLVSDGQKPEVMIIGCADSRVDPTVVTDAGPGEVFTVRNVANLVPPYEQQGKYHGTSAALEFAVRDLLVKHIVVLGHSQCGGIKALYEGLDQTPETRQFIAPWISLLHEVRDHVKAQHGDEATPEALNALERAGVEASIDNLMSFDFVADRVIKGELELHGWHFEIASGTIYALDKEEGEFKPIVD